MSNSQYNSKRKRSIPTESSFSEELYNTGQYFSDYDLIVTDNSTYHQYVFFDGDRYLSKPKIKRIIEVKSRATPYVKRQMRNEDPPNVQTLAFASVVSEVNSFRVSDKLELWFIIQQDGHYPYHVYNFDCANNQFDFLKTVQSRVEFIKLLEN